MTARIAGCIRCLWREWLTIESADKYARVQADPSTAASPATSKYPANCKFDQCLFPAKCYTIAAGAWILADRRGDGQRAAGFFEVKGHSAGLL